METLLRWVLGFLADYIIAFVKNFKAARADNPALFQVAEDIITQLNGAHPDWTGQQKRDFAFSAIQAVWKELIKDTLKSAGASAEDVLKAELPANADSIVNFIIEITVQRLKAK